MIPHTIATSSTQILFKYVEKNSLRLIFSYCKHMVADMKRSGKLVKWKLSVLLKAPG